MALDENVTAGETGHIAAHATLKAEYDAAGATPGIAAYTLNSTAAQHATIHNALHVRHNALGSATTLPTNLTGNSSGFLAAETALNKAYNLRYAPLATQTLYTTQTPTTPSANDGQGITVGTLFTADTGGQVSGIRLYLPTTAPTSAVGLLFDNSGNELARATFGALSAGWNTVTFTTPVTVQPTTTYRAAYWTNGPYVASSGLFPFTNSHLTASSSAYVYGASPAYPSNASVGAYFADPVYSVVNVAATAPAVPAAPSVVPGNTQATVTWTAPSANGSAITGYTVLNVNTSAAVTVGNVLTATITGLTNGTAYTFKVLASNAVGSSAYSAASSAVTPAVPTIPGGAVTHGDQLTINHVGPWTLQGVAKGSETLTTADTSVDRVSTYPGYPIPSFVPTTPYVYNNATSNHGGVVPAGGLTIDGYFVPAGTWVVQFRTITTNVIITGDSGGAGSAWPGIMFRGCRMRANWSSPGWINYNAESSGGITWMTYCDAGGLDFIPPNVCEGIFESQGTGASRDKQYVIRCYLSITSNLAGGRNNGDAFVENLCRDVPRYYNNDTYHIGGLMNSGGQTATLFLRNNIDFSPQPGTNNPYYKPQVSCIQMAADGPGYPGTGTNMDGSRGYQIRDNYLGGADYSLQLGLDKSNTAADVSWVVVTGNKFTTKWFPLGGNFGPSYKNPIWGTIGNVWSGNTWADDYGTGNWSGAAGTWDSVGRQYTAGNGPRAGATVAAPTNQ